jgi:hypothetical protein
MYWRREDFAEAGEKISPATGALFVSLFCGSAT